MKEVMGGLYSTHETREEYLQNFSRKTEGKGYFCLKGKDKRPSA
jgi:hypothetical protein